MVMSLAKASALDKVRPEEKVKGEKVKGLANGHFFLFSPLGLPARWAI